VAVFVLGGEEDVGGCCGVGAGDRDAEGGAGIIAVGLEQVRWVVGLIEGEVVFAELGIERFGGWAGEAIVEPNDIVRGVGVLVQKLAGGGVINWPRMGLEFGEGWAEGDG